MPTLLDKLLILCEKMDSDVPPEPEWMKITKAEYYEKYKERMFMFYKESVAIHEHNSFSEEYMSTLTEFGFTRLGGSIVQNLEKLAQPDQKFTLVEVGAGTGIGVMPICEAMHNKQNKQITKYIYTDPFNSLQKQIKNYKNLQIKSAQTDIIGAIKGIQTDDTIENAILLVCCPPPIHENRYGSKDHMSYQLVSTDVMALVESVQCHKIKYVMIVRYNDGGRRHLDGTIDLYDFHIPLLEKFNMWYLHTPMDMIDAYGNSVGDRFYRTLHVFSRNK